MKVKIDVDLVEKVEEWANAHRNCSPEQFVNKCVRIQVLPHTIDQMKPWGAPEEPKK